MVQVKDLTQLALEDLWHGVKWGEAEEEGDDLGEIVRGAIKRFLEGAMEGDIVDRLRVGLYKRTEFRRGYRNGYRYRSLLTQFGLIENLRVPRDRAGEFRRQVLTRYQRSEPEVNKMIRDLFLAGVSTRRAGKALAPLLGCRPSAQTVSRVARSLDEEVQRRVPPTSSACG